MSKQAFQVKFVREDFDGEVSWDVLCNGESVGRITQQREDYSRIVAGYWVEVDGEHGSEGTYIDTDCGYTSARLCFKNAKDEARSILATQQLAARIEADKQHLKSLFAHPNCK